MYDDLAELYERAAKTLPCNALRFFLAGQAARLRILGSGLEERVVYTETTKGLLEQLVEMHRPRRSADVLRPDFDG